jgi:hypothetical protein
VVADPEGGGGDVRPPPSLKKKERERVVVTLLEDALKQNTGEYFMLNTIGRCI